MSGAWLGLALVGTVGRDMSREAAPKARTLRRVKLGLLAVLRFVARATAVNTAHLLARDRL